MYQGIITINSNQWNVDIATTPSELSQGLGGLSSMPLGVGMFFDLGYSQPVNVTTYPMLFPIDIAFISDELVITQIERNVPPGVIITPDPAIRFWLEVNAGELVNVEVGDALSIELLTTPILQPDYLACIMPIMAIGIFGAVGVNFAKSIAAPPTTKAIMIPPTRAIAIRTQQYPYERRVRIELRKYPTSKLCSIYGKLSSNEATNIPLLDENKEVASKVAYDVLWERGKGSYTQIAKIVTVPLGPTWDSDITIPWRCEICGKVLKPGEKTVVIENKVYCPECARSKGRPYRVEREVKYYADTANNIEKGGFMFQTELDSAFTEAIKRAKKLYG